MNPGYAGGSNWGGVAVDAGRQIAVTNVIQTPALVRLIPAISSQPYSNPERSKGGA